MVKKKQRLKTETVGLRMSAKLRYGLELIARKRHTTLSALMVSAAEKLLEEEGLTERQPGKPFTLLDLLWSEDDAERKIALEKHAPELASNDDPRDIRNTIISLSIKMATSGADLLWRLKCWPSHKNLIQEIERRFYEGDNLFTEAITNNEYLNREFKDEKDLIDWLALRDEEDRRANSIFQREKFDEK